MSVTRRAALSRSLAMAAGAAAFLRAKPGRAAEPVHFVSDPFKLGVASGDPTPDGLVLWTRLAPNPLEPDGGLGDQVIEVKWTIAADPAFKTIVKAGVEIAHRERGHSVHAEVMGLQPDRPYWYRFEAGGVRSPTGRGRTLPVVGSPKDRFRIAWASCQHFEQGYFSAYRDMVAWGPDLILHMGDYIYESSWGPQVRRHPNRDPWTLDDYRIHHAVYKLDPDLQAAHAATSWAFIWDDHDVSNDYAGLVPPNPADLEGFPARRAAAYQTWFENLPLGRRSLTQGLETRIYQQLIVGDLVQFLLLDTRQYRAPRACVSPDPTKWRTGVRACPEMASPDRGVLGSDQEFWLTTSLNRSATRWTSLVQPTLFSDMKQKTPDGQWGGYQDGWSGYPAARQKILDRLAARRNRDTVIIGGDMHAFMVADVKADFAKPDSPVIAAEFVGTSVTSHSYNYDGWQLLLQDPGNAHLKLADDRTKGWAGAEITPGAWAVTFRGVSSVWDPNPTFSTHSRWAVEWGKPGVQPA